MKEILVTGTVSIPNMAGNVAKPQSISEMVDKRDGVTSKPDGPIIDEFPPIEEGPYTEAYIEEGVYIEEAPHIEEGAYIEEVEREMFKDESREIELRGIVAQAWCSNENLHKEMDVTLAREIARLIYQNEQER